MTAAVASLTVFPSAVALVSALAGLASLINALELLWLARAGTSTYARSTEAPAMQPRIVRHLHDRRAFAIVLVMQCGAAVALATREGAAWATILMFTTYVSALRLRGNVNGGSDAMLFTVLGGLTLARLDAAPLFWREAGFLYIAAQLVLSYLRAGVAKAQHRAWWTGEALGDLMKLPAYGVPAGIWSTPLLLRAASVGVIVFECASPLAFVHPTLCAMFIGAAFVFHAMTAMLFGLNRFLLAWTAALPSLWYAVHRAQ